MIKDTGLGTNELNETGLGTNKLLTRTGTGRQNMGKRGGETRDTERQSLTTSPVLTLHKIYEGPLLSRNIKLRSPVCILVAD